LLRVSKQAGRRVYSNTGDIWREEGKHQSVCSDVVGSHSPRSRVMVGASMELPFASRVK
jgi:hypothetical protein